MDEVDGKRAADEEDNTARRDPLAITTEWRSLIAFTSNRKE